ncbi:kinesin-like protein KIF13A isoform X1 [Aquarana catesbeiana]|uniref:kinesin-like protein KIF13A isoform X1 n=1 Tax=Aquarana catesbeiana TaxID=8400 RepID=UPI003CC9F7DE
MNNSKVKVAVRVRPLNQREEGLNSECVVRVSGTQITLLPPISFKEKDRKEPHIFTYDNCFWTEDRHDTGQEDVFEHLGDGALENIWLGYNVCIFAYGQTGSGKTFSMMGTDNQPGIVPRICSALFNKESNDLETIRIEASYFEIYNEEVRDLLRSAKNQKKLRVREDRLIGPYVEELSCHAVQSYGEIKLLLDQGNKQRAIAETKMNEQSSRSHSILTLTITQTCNDQKSGASRELVSKVSLVDLAGSERSYKSGAQGSQLKESCNINKSLLTLGLVINSLAEISENKRKSQYVNYRDSVLTWLLKNNLGGNSKTIMLATVSPAADNYQETLSTLRYADSAKRIVNQAVVNEDVKSKVIEELQEEIKRLREQLTTTEQVKAEVQELKLHLEEKENLLRDLKTSWEEKLRRTEIATQKWQKNIENMGVILNKQDVVFSNQCYLIQQSTALIIHNINDITKIGSGPSQDIQISGPEAECEHCEIRKTEEGEVFLTPVGNSKTYVNGCLSKTLTQLWHEDKIQIGSNVFILHLPNRPKPDHMKTNVSIEAEDQRYDELNTENYISSILSKRDRWNSSMTEGEKSKTNSAMSENHKTTHGFTQTIPASDDDCNSSKNKHISDIFTEISNKSNSPHNNVNTTGNTQSEYRELGVGTQVQPFIVQCSPQYGEASFQTSKTLQSSNYFRNTPHQEYNFTLPSGGGRRNTHGFFCWDKDTDLQWLTDLLPRTSISAASICCISHPPGDYWKTEVHKFSPIIFCHSFTTQAKWTQLEEFLRHCTGVCGKRVVIIMADVMDGDAEQTVRKDWGRWKFSGCDLITLTRQEIDSVSTNRSALQRAMPEKIEYLKKILQTSTDRIPVPSVWKKLRKQFHMKKVEVGIFSRSSESDYSWLVNLLRSADFCGWVQSVTPCYISNNGFQRFKHDVSQCTFGVLYHTKNWGRVNVTDVKESLYDEELQYLHDRLGKDNVIVVIDDMNEVSDLEKNRILENQPSIRGLARDLFLFSHNEKMAKSDPRHKSNLKRKMAQLESIIKGNLY